MSATFEITAEDLELSRPYRNTGIIQFWSPYFEQWCSHPLDQFWPFDPPAYDQFTKFNKVPETPWTKPLF